MTRKDTYTPMFIAALFTVAKTWEQARRPSSEEQVKKMWRTQHTHTQTQIHTHTQTHTQTQTYTHTMEYYRAIKKDEIMPLVATWMALESY